MSMATTIITDMFDYDFMINAFAAAGIVAVVSGIVGYFLVMRGQTFAGHALSHIGFAGATGAGLIGLAPLWGLIAFTLAAGVIMGALSERISNRDVAIGVVLALALGFGLLFLHYHTSFATQATALLFGNVLAVDHAMIATLEFVARSDWVTILPSVISVNDIGRGELIVNPIINPELHAEFVVIQPTRRKLSMQARMFLERFEAEVTHIHNIWDRAIAEPRKLRA